MTSRGNDSIAKNVPLKQLANEAYTALFDYADALTDAGTPEKEVCNEVRRVAQEIVAQFARGRS